MQAFASYGKEHSMRFRVQAADPETGDEVLWEIEAATVQEARQRAIDSGYLVAA